METAVTIDTDILSRAMEAADILSADRQTQRRFVENALQIFTLQNRQGEARKYRGKLQWEGSLDELRTAKW